MTFIEGGIVTFSAFSLTWGTYLLGNTLGFIPSIYEISKGGKDAIMDDIRQTGGLGIEKYNPKGYMVTLNHPVNYYEMAGKPLPTVISDILERVGTTSECDKVLLSKLDNQTFQALSLCD